MPVWEFTLIIEGPDIQGDDIINALFEAGCGDSLVGSTNGVQYMDFDREAPTLADAVLSAVSAVESVPGVQVAQLEEADLVSIAEIAERTDRTRESVRLLVAGERGPGGFPSPVSDVQRPNRLWRWTEVDRWMQNAFGDGDAQPSNDEIMLSALAAAIAARHHCRRLDPSQRERVRSLFAA